MPQWRTHSCGKIKWTGKQNCEFDSTRKCISTNSLDFSKFIVFKVKDPQNLPLKNDWCLIKENDKEVLWNRIHAYIFFFL